jgi:hypothetical protein
MKHYAMSQWVDMIRGLVTGRELAEMTAHLSSGCSTCRHTADILQKVADLAAWEQQHKIPSYAIHNARAVFALQRPEKVCFFPRILGQLIYDSFKEPLPAGLRARHRLARHVLYKAGHYSMDIRMEHQKGTAIVTLVGQIVDQTNPGTPPASLPVFLVCGRKPIANAYSNTFGEFQFAYEPKQRVRLYIQGIRDRRKSIELPLDSLAGSENPPKKSS